MADEMLERLGDVTREFARALVIGCPDDRIAKALRARGMAVTCADPGPAFAAACGGDVVREDDLPYPPGSFDLILCCGTLESVNDLPGALIALNRALVPDGLLLVSFIGAGSLVRLRAALMAGDGDRPAQRLHPQVDVRALGDLLHRAGFAMPVADHEPLEVRYGSLLTLLADLRGMGAAQCLDSAPPPLTPVRPRTRHDRLCRHGRRRRPHHRALRHPAWQRWHPAPSQAGQRAGAAARFRWRRR